MLKNNSIGNVSAWGMIPSGEQQSIEFKQKAVKVVFDICTKTTSYINALREHNIV